MSKQKDIFDVKHAAIVLRSDHCRRRTRFDDAYRKFTGRSDGGDATAGQHYKQFAVEPERLADERRVSAGIYRK